MTIAIGTLVLRIRIGRDQQGCCLAAKHTVGKIQDATAWQMEIKPLSSPLSIFFDIWNTSSWRCLHLIWEQGQSVHKLTRGECRAMITFVISQLSGPHTLLLPFIFIRYYSSLFSFNLRYFFAFHSMPKRSSIEEKAKFYRRESEVLSNIYRRPIEHLSKTYRTSIEDLSKTYRIEHVETFSCHYSYRVCL